jgi:hypothetical protein
MSLKKIGHNVTGIVDSLSVNNLIFLDNQEIVNQKLYKKILKSRIDLIKMKII